MQQLYHPSPKRSALRGVRLGLSMLMGVENGVVTHTWWGSHRCWRFASCSGRPRCSRACRSRQSRMCRACHQRCMGDEIKLTHYNSHGAPCQPPRSPHHHQSSSSTYCLWKAKQLTGCTSSAPPACFTRWHLNANFRSCTVGSKSKYSNDTRPSMVDSA